MKGHNGPRQQGDFTVDFMPYEGAPQASQNDLKRTSLVVAITAVILAGAGWLAVLTPVSNLGSFDDPPAEAMAMKASLSVVTPTLVAGVASSDSDVGPGSAESALACQGAAVSKTANRRPASKLTALGHPKLAAR